MHVQAAPPRVQVLGPSCSAHARQACQGRLLDWGSTFVPFRGDVLRGHHQDVDVGIRLHSKGVTGASLGASFGQSSIQALDLVGWGTEGLKHAGKQELAKVAPAMQPRTVLTCMHS